MLKNTEGKGGKKIDVEFYWPPAPTGPTAGYTAPLKGWKETVITGLTTEPISLKGWYSQTYAPGHHNFWEEFLLEPSKEEGISNEQLEELEDNDVKMIYLFIDRGRSSNAYIIGFDDEGDSPIQSTQPEQVESTRPELSALALASSATVVGVAVAMALVS